MKYVYYGHLENNTIYKIEAIKIINSEIKRITREKTKGHKNMSAIWIKN